MNSSKQVAGDKVRMVKHARGCKKDNVANGLLVGSVYTVIEIDIYGVWVRVADTDQCLEEVEVERYVEGNQLVVIESPFGSPDKKVVLENVVYLFKCISDSLKRGEAPYASHGLYPGALDDAKPHERQRGMEAGFAWGEKAEKVVVYVDRGISMGMIEGIKRHQANGIPIEYRSLQQEIK